MKDNGHLLYATTREDRFVAETSFTLSPVNLFDQAYVRAGNRVTVARC